MKFYQMAVLIIFILLTSRIKAAEPDVAVGKNIFKKCSSCHSLEEGKSKIEPSFFGIIGKAAATDEKFKATIADWQIYA